MDSDAKFRAAGGSIGLEAVLGADISGVVEKAGAGVTHLAPVDLTPLYQRNQTLYGVFLTRERARQEELGTPIERGQVRPLVVAEVPLEEVGKAHERLQADLGLIPLL